LQISAAVIRGNIAIPSAKSLKRLLPKRKRQLPADMPVISDNVRSPAEIARAKRTPARDLGCLKPCEQVA
jgi:hypothetical protein